MEVNKSLIIMVDDNPANLRIGKNVLAEKYTVATAPSAEKLFNLLENNLPVMILLDIDMPDIDGYEAIKILKSKPETKDIPVVFLTGRGETDDELTGLSLGAVDYITKPIQPPLLLKRIEVHLLVEEQKKTMEKQAADLKYFNENLQKMVDEKTKNIMELQNALLKTMAELVEYRDDITGRHIERTQEGIRILLTEIKSSGLYSEESEDWDIELLVQCCQLHDVGKIFISDNILRKPGELNDDEFEDMKVHTQIGKQIVEKVELLTNESEFLKFAKVFAAAHHEWWDGTGYPHGLKGNEIPLLGRIMAIADVYDALVSQRPYKKAFTHEEAVKIISEGSGTHFDPALVEVFLKTEDQFKELTIGEIF
uniref:Response regulator n=1 Tax=uncultured bacterium contig00010 TaxID=1181502 RepID=A0A806JXV0_9BACT|nr:response regulator [uncultured bacterium contig00010]